MSIKIPKKTSAQLGLSPRSAPDVRVACRTPENARRNLNLRQLLTQRLRGQPLTRDKKLRDSTLADEIALKLLNDARNGKIQAVQLLIEASESNIIRQRFVNFVIDRIYHTIIQHIPDPNSPILHAIARDLYTIKHRVGQSGRRDHIYTDPSELKYEFHEDVDVAADLSKGLPPKFKPI